MNIKFPKITFWRVVFVIIMAFGLYSTYLRFFKGLGASTNLSDHFAWGLWIGFDALCGIMLTAGAFTLLGAVYVFNIERWRPIVRPALVTAFLGYLLEVFALMYDLGKPYNIWHPLIMWNPRSPMFLIGWCVMVYTSVMALEFLPVVLKRLRYDKPLRIIRAFSIPVVITGVIMGVIHQSALGSLYLIVPGKLHPLWYTSMLPVLFFISAVAAGLAMTIFESAMSARHFDHALEKPVINSIGRVLTVALIVYGVVRFYDLIVTTGNIKYAFQYGYESSMFWVEIFLALVVPIGLLSVRKVRENPTSLYFVSILTVLGFVINRLNVAVTGMEASSGVHYVPKWSEVSVTLMIVSCGILAFGLVAKYLPIFEHPHSHSGVIPRGDAESPAPKAGGFRPAVGMTQPAR